MKHISRSHLKNEIMEPKDMRIAIYKYCDDIQQFILTFRVPRYRTGKAQLAFPAASYNPLSSESVIYTNIIGTQWEVANIVRKSDRKQCLCRGDDGQ